MCIHVLVFVNMYDTLCVYIYTHTYACAVLLKSVDEYTCITQCSVNMPVCICEAWNASVRECSVDTCCVMECLKLLYVVCSKCMLLIELLCVSYC